MTVEFVTRLKNKIISQNFDVYYSRINLIPLLSRSLLTFVLISKR
jgi:hypothetical protein